MCVCVSLARDQGSVNMAVELCQLSSGAGEGGGGEEEKRKTERNEEEKEEMKKRGEDSILCSLLMKGGIGSFTPTLAFSLSVMSLDVLG